MLQGICVNPLNTEVLNKGERYFLFPNGPHHYYVSRFPNPGAHRGCFLAESFELIDNEIELHKDKLYKAQLVYREPGYKDVELTEYFLKVRTTHADFYRDQQLTRMRACFPLEWFTDFEEVDPEEAEMITEELMDIDLEEIPMEPEPTEFEQLSLFEGM